MLKEVKYLVFVIIIFLFLFLTGRYYFSDNNKKNYFRSINNINKKNDIYAEKLPILKNNTQNIIEYIEASNNKKKKKFNFWKLLETNE
tara:strand:+ start:483 stop:746 length:264 start_codon:yes stop_codon:yes gene_type:complete